MQEILFVGVRAGDCVRVCGKQSEVHTVASTSLVLRLCDKSFSSFVFWPSPDAVTGRKWMVESLSWTLEANYAPT